MVLISVLVVPDAVWTVVLVSSEVLPPLTWVRVTGQIVVLVSITTVVMTSDSAGEVTADETGEEVITAEVVSTTEETGVLSKPEDVAETVVSVPTALEVATD
jgi:hypothetical protein